MGKRNQHVIVHQSQIRQSDHLKKTNTRKYMKPSTETSLHGNNTFNNPNKNNPKTSKQTHNKNQNTNTNTNKNEAQNTRYEVRE